MIEERILVVCAANVCRSPQAAMMLRRGLGAGSTIAVDSAGVRAVDGDAICTTVAALHDDYEWRVVAAAHRAREITPELIERAGLVLTASRDIRGELVRMAPRSRDWMFTLKEAAHLGSGFSSSASDRVAEYVAYLDRARSRAVPIAEPTDVASRVRRLVGRRGSVDPTSIADRHGSRRHRDTISEVGVAVAAIVAQLSGPAPHSS